MVLQDFLVGQGGVPPPFSVPVRSGHRTVTLHLYSQLCPNISCSTLGCATNTSRDMSYTVDGLHDFPQGNGLHVTEYTVLYMLQLNECLLCRHDTCNRFYRRTEHMLTGDMYRTRIRSFPPGEVYRHFVHQFHSLLPNVI